VTALRPERPADGPMSYEDTGQFKAVVERLDDPLNDPLPGRPDAVPEPAYAEPASPEPEPEPGPEPWPEPQPAFETPAFEAPAFDAQGFDAQGFAPLIAPADAEEELDLGTATVVPDAGGGRAARRKAARQSGGSGGSGGGHRARGRTPAGPSPAPAARTPLSRVEARRAAKAAKESPAVVISRIVGELFITTGVLMLLFVTYQLWWTNVRAHQQASGAANHLQHQWDAADGDPHRIPGIFTPGQGFAIMYIPKLDVKAPIAQGVSKHKVLDKGMIGHYDGALNTAMPWDRTGNFAVAAHRNTHGEPFRYINHLVPGDKVVVETASMYYTYEITKSLPSTPPSNTSVIRPVPVGSGFTRPGRYLTLTTCTPEFTSTNRLIVWGRMIEERPRSKGKPDALVE
jgi:sortase A